MRCMAWAPDVVRGFGLTFGLLAVFGRGTAKA